MRHPQNAEGRFWIDQNTCCDCEACFVEAPQNIVLDESLRMSYVFKQPESAEELQALRDAIRFCPVEAVIEDKE